MVVLQGREVVVVVRLGTEQNSPEVISIIIPVINEAESLEQFLVPLQSFRSKQCEIIVVDGGSTDQTCNVADKLCDHLLVSEAGRAKQMNKGAACASGSVFLFLHADTILPTNFFELITRQMQHKNKPWGRFDVSLSGSELMFRIIEKMMNFRSCFTGIATGDQAMFVRREVFVKLGGFPDISLMEDVALSKMLKKIDLPLCISTRVITSSRRWEKYGIWRTIILMWQLRLAYFLGSSPDELKKRYL